MKKILQKYQKKKLTGNETSENNIEEEQNNQGETISLDENSSSDEDHHLQSIRNQQIPEECKNIFKIEENILELNKKLCNSELSENKITKMATPLTLSLDPLKYFEKLCTFDGRQEDLHNFINNVEGIIPTLKKYDEQSQLMCINVLKSKLLGKAKRCIEIHPHLHTWDEVKNILENNFGGFKNSFTLYDELRNINFKGNVMGFYNDIQKMLCELNQKTMQEGKTHEITHNNATALNVFKEKLPTNMRTVLFSLKPTDLHSALNELIQAGFVTENNYKEGRNDRTR